MKSIPLLLKGPLVRRSLDGRKRMTRRLVTSLAGIGPVREFQRSTTQGYDWTFRRKDGCWCDITPAELMAACPYGTAGDELWGRETFRPEELASGLDGYRFKADNAFVPIADTEQAMQAWIAAKASQRGNTWRPAIFMPREACRLVMNITEVRLERLQAITDADIQAEGVADLTLDELLEMGATRSNILKTTQSVLPRIGGYDWLLVNVMWPQSFTMQERFQILWDLIYGADPATCWDGNPWVWVISYKRQVTT